MRLAVVVALVGCGSSTSDVTPDTPTARCAEWTFQPHLFDACALPETGVDVQLTRFEQGYVLDGNTGVIYRGPEEVEFTVPRIEIDGLAILVTERMVVGQFSGVTIQSDLPIVFVSWDDIEVLGGINATPTQRDGLRVPAPGAPGPGCVPATTGGFDAGSGGGGFRGIGGSGGNGTTGIGGAGGGTRVLPERLSAGCDGADSATPGTGGLAGGALGLVARTRLTIAGRLGANSDGGLGVLGEGGAGGGSGGMVELEAETITVTDTADISACGADGAGNTIFKTSCVEIIGYEGDTNASGSGIGAGGGGGAGYLMFRAHDTVTIDPAATIAPSLLPF